MDDYSLRDADYEAVRALLYQWTGIRLQNKQQMVLGRLSPRLRSLGLGSFLEYVERVRREGRAGSEAQPFINQLTTNKTSFFREPHHFDFLRQYLSKVVAARALETGDRKVRLWSAASSTGEEPYTLAMVAEEVLPSSAGWDVKVRATDIDTEVLRAAQLGEYDVERLADIPAASRQRWFSAAGPGKVRVVPELARRIRFEQLNLVGDGSFGNERYDTIFCRNVIIYFDTPTQNRLVERLARCLTPAGRLFLGHSETLIGSELERVPNQVGVYRHKAGGTEAAPTRTVAGKAAPSPARATPSLARPKASQPRPAVTELDVRLPHQRIVLGEWKVATEPSIISTLLGSCVSACLFDAESGIGGMNHFMLPNCTGGQADAANFGLHAMELLINGLMTRGATRKHLRAKAFGAGAVTKALPATVGEMNAAFIRQFLAKEGIPLVVERLGGDRPREVFLQTDTGQVLVRAISPQKAKALEQRELGAWNKRVESPNTFDADDALF